MIFFCMAKRFWLDVILEMKGLVIYYFDINITFYGSMLS